MKRAAAAVMDVMQPSTRDWLLRQAAVAPPGVKTLLFERLCRAASRSCVCRDHLIVTNLGISRSIRCEMPLHKSNYVFGRPASNIAERGTLALVTELAKDCSHFLDVGANEGIFIFSVGAKQSDIALHWFEPDNVLAERLTSNLERNTVAARGNAVAVSDASGRSIFYKNLSDDASGSLTDYFASTHSIRPELVSTVRLDDYLTAHEVTNAIVKIDVEGAGRKVWHGIAEEYGRITYLIIEMLEPEITAQLPLEIIDMTGWHAWYIRDRDLVESRKGEFPYLAPFWNWLFCHLDAPALAARLAGSKLRIVPAG